MKAEIESLNLLYGVTIYNILCKYQEFKILKIEEIKKVAKNLNEYLIWLESKDNINSFNIIHIATTIIDNKKIRNYIITNNTDKLNYLTNEILKNINLKKININIDNNYIKLSEKEQISDKIVDFWVVVDDTLYKNTLIYSDIIKYILLDKNFKFKKRSYSCYIYFLNLLNRLIYEVDIILSSSRTNLCECIKYLVNSKNILNLLFPKSYRPYITLDNMSVTLKREIIIMIHKAFYQLNQYYNILVPDFNYDNSKIVLKISQSSENNVFQLLLKNLDVKQISFLFYIESTIIHSNNRHSFNNEEIQMLESIINNLKRDNNIKIISQKITDKKLELVNENIKGFQDYCNQKKLKYTIETIDTKNKEKSNYIHLFVAYINYNNFNYRFVIKKSNSTINWNLTKKNNKIYRIKLLTKEDCKHIIEAMLQE